MTSSYPVERDSRYGRTNAEVRLWRSLGVSKTPLGVPQTFSNLPGIIDGRILNRVFLKKYGFFLNKGIKIPDPH